MTDSDARIPEPGDVLAGKYEVIRRVAEGGMGVVLEARHARLGHRVAVKVLRAEVRALPQVAARFEREARAAARITGPHSVRVMDVDALPDGSPFMVMEMLAGHDLGDELDARGPLPAEEAVGYLLEACAGMAEAHALGIVHRDLKPSNLFLAEEGNERRLKVLDFGISKAMNEGDVKMTATSSVLGTPLYMSPEQVRSSKNVDERTDVWSLGVILYELLTGRPPFDSESATAVAAAIVADEVRDVREHVPDLDPGLAQVVMKALEKKADARFQSVTDLALALAEHASESARRSLRTPPSGALQASPSGPTSRQGAPTLAAADTLVASPAAPAASRATEPGWTAVPRTKTFTGARRGVAVALVAAALGAFAWLAMRAPDAPEVQAAPPLAEAPSEARGDPPGVPAAPANPSVEAVGVAPAEPAQAPLGAPSASAKTPPSKGATKAPEKPAPTEAPKPPKPAAAPPTAKNPLRL